jgi:hypothetical protein
VRLPLFSFKNIGLIYPPDSSSPQDQKQNEMEDQETAPDKQGNVNYPDGFMGGMKTHQEPCF